MKLAFLLGLIGCSTFSDLAIGGEMTDEVAIRKALGKEAPKQALVRAWSGRSVTGARLYTVEGGGMAPTGLAVVEGAGERQVIRGPEAFRALVATAGQGDAHLLAQLSVHFIEQGEAGGKVIPTTGPAPELMPEQAALVNPPSLAEGRLTYWRWPAPVGSDRTHTAPEPWRCTLVMDTLVVSCERMPTGKP